jgi:NTP pyrophosphatase (non-canonical NTP hydrolase)
MELISTKNKLPDIDGSYLVLTPQSFPKNSPFVIAQYYVDDESFYSEVFEIRLKDVTHWSELPKYPVKNQKTKQNIEKQNIDLSSKELNLLANQIYLANKEKGFHDTEGNIPQMIALLHSEASEMLEADRKNRWANEKDLNKALRIINENGTPLTFKTFFNENIKDTLQDELADLLIRTLDFAGKFNINISAHQVVKRYYNSLREPKHGKQY